MSQIVGKFEEGGWIRLISFSSLYIIGHLVLLSDGGKRSDELARHLIRDVCRIQGTTAELLTWQTHMIQTYRQNLMTRIERRRHPEQKVVKLQPYPPYQIHYDQH